MITSTFWIGERVRIHPRACGGRMQHWGHGTIMEVKRKTCQVRFDNGPVELVDQNNLRPWNSANGGAEPLTEIPMPEPIKAAPRTTPWPSTPTKAVPITQTAPAAPIPMLPQPKLVQDAPEEKRTNNTLDRKQERQLEDQILKDWDAIVKDGVGYTEYMERTIPKMGFSFSYRQVRSSVEALGKEWPANARIISGTAAKVTRDELKRLAGWMIGCMEKLGEAIPDDIRRIAMNDKAKGA